MCSCSANPMDGGMPSSWSGTQEDYASQQKDQPGVQSMYCKELVFAGETEFSFEELRAQRYYKQVNEKVQHLSKVKEELKFQIEQKQKLVQGRNGGTQHQQLEVPKHSLQNAEGSSAPVCTNTAPLKNYSEPEMSENPSMRTSQVSQDEDLGQGRTVFKQWGSQASKLFSIHDENSLPEKPNTRSSSTNHKSLKLPTSILKARKPSLECPNDKNASLSRSEEAIINGHWNKTLCRSPDDTCDFVHAAMLASTPFGGPVRQNASERAIMEQHESLNKTATGIFKEPNSEPIAEAKKLSPIQEISHEWGYTSIASICLQELESKGRVTTHSGSTETSQSAPEKTESVPAPRAERVNPCSLDVRKALLDNMDLSSFPNFSRNIGPLPEPDDLYIDGETLFFPRKMGDCERYLYCSSAGNVLVKVDTSTVPWDFYISSQMRSRLSADQQHCHVQSTCYVYENGSLTLWKVPQGQTIQELIEEHVDRRDVPLIAIRLMEMVKQMHSCRLVHGALQPETLMLCYSCDDSVMGVDFSSSLDMELQPGINTVQDLPSAQKYIDQGLLLASASPYQVDLCGIAEVVHLLLVGRSVKINKEGSFWRLAEDSGLNLSEPVGALWEDFFHNLLNPEDISTETVLTNLINNLKNILYDGLECPISL
ncbi:mitotic checkpoint serine/threonine-protein kinase BUB1 beta isoform X2 [Trichomycterus rosablanca]|uniref:mitotic checkpoint serine/threonine-protein kinase BUB1 beta isoform X2 n=1 Tax=Trichomycterus rosablanca TaxID=2290929 RepID=UPI002F355727